MDRIKLFPKIGEFSPVKEQLQPQGIQGHQLIARFSTQLIAPKSLLRFSRFES